MAEGVRTLGATSAADTPPPNPYPGERWVDTSSGIEYLWFPAPNVCWVEINPTQNLPPGEVLELAFPGDPEPGDRYTNGSGKEWVFNGIGWGASKSVVVEAGTAERPGLAIGFPSTGWFAENAESLVATLAGAIAARIASDLAEFMADVKVAGRLKAGTPEDASFSDDVQTSFDQIAAMIGTAAGETGEVVGALVGRIDDLEADSTAQGAAIASVASRATALEAANATNLGATSTLYTASATITKPAGAKACRVRLWGPGGLGGPVNDEGECAGGGGSGGYAEKFYAASALAATTALTINTTLIQFGASLIANKGGAGDDGGAGGNAGTASGGDINKTGYVGKPGTASEASGAGADALDNMGIGGAGQTYSIGVKHNGLPGTGYSSGGGGATSNFNADNATGGAPGGALAQIEWFF